MAYELLDSRYGFSFKTTNDASGNGKSATKSINYVNLSLGGSSSGYSPDDVGTFIDSVATSIMGSAYTYDRTITDQRPLEMGA